MIIKNRILYFIIIFISAIILIDLICFDIALSANNPKIIIDKNLKLGMTLKEAIELLGPPDKIEVNDNGMLKIPYAALGLSVEATGDGNIIKGIHIQSSFKGQIDPGLEIGSDFQKILSVYNQPDLMTKEIIEYHDLSRNFKLQEGRLSGADIYPAKSPLYGKEASIVTQKSEDKETVKYVAAPEEVSEVTHEQLRKELRDEIRNEVREEVRKEVRDEVREESYKGVDEEADVFDIYGFKVKSKNEGVFITEVRPGSVAEKGGLKVGEPIRKAFYEDLGVRNIYYQSGLEKILRRAIQKNKKTVSILQSENRYYEIEVPRTW